MKHILSLVLLSITCLACHTNSNTSSDQAQDKAEATEAKTKVKAESPKLVRQIQQSHNTMAFFDHEAVQFNLNLQFDEALALQAKVSMTTNSSQITFQNKNGQTLYFQNNQFYKTPAIDDYPKARFDVLTWAYFLTLPFKLNDAGTQWSEFTTKALGETNYDTGKLEFSANTGDAPDDWYIVYADQNTHLLKAAAYIVTYSKSQEQAEENPHAIVYKRYFSLNQVPFSSQWEFYNWSAEKGIYGKPIGKATISNVKFIAKSHPVFQKPKHTIEIKK